MVLLLRGLGFILIGLAFVAIIAGHGMVWYKEGFWAMADMLSPSNIFNTLFMALLIAPGLCALWLADKLNKRRQ